MREKERTRASVRTGEDEGSRVLMSHTDEKRGRGKINRNERGEGEER